MVQGLGWNEDGLFASADDYHTSVSKRTKLNFPQSNHQEVDSSKKSSPLGLTLTKTPSFVNLVEMKLSQTRSKSCSNEKHQALVQETKMDGFVPQPMSDREKLKASNFPALLLKIGSWERLTRQEGDLIAKCYYAKRKIVWEVLEGSLKSKIEIQWSDIEAIRAIIRNNEPGILEIQLKQSPLFFRETNPQPRKHTIWHEASDFTGGQARICRIHLVKFPPGTLDKHYEKLLQCDDHLWELSQRPFPSLNSLYFCSSNIDGVLEIPFDFTSCNSPFPRPTIPPSLVPPHQTQNFKLPTGQPLDIVNSKSPMSVFKCQWRKQNSTDSALENQWMDPNTGVLFDFENHFLSESQNEWSNERKLLARLRSMCQPFQEASPENVIGMNQLEYNQETFYNEPSILGGNETFKVGGGIINPRPIDWLPSQVFDENQTVNFVSANSLYPYELSQQKVMDYAASGVGHKVDR
ncbi:uncharacterized protein LOC131325626 [Rhododendron vialii]|uniref:uncharacterized protein LOC131325626 n=1 Tax=Rhododendron vialii TaxID=182163 RepID=UPI00265DF4E9|nr:uncharacterized protein LOC131325626 [Rhododendron vialii]